MGCSNANGWCGVTASCQRCWLMTYSAPHRKNWGVAGPALPVPAPAPVQVPAAPQRAEPARVVRPWQVVRAEREGSLVAKVKANKFCSLSGAPTWQAWLFGFDPAIYRVFMERMAKARGCGGNTQVMMGILAEIEQRGGSRRLLDFLAASHPSVLA